VSLTDRTTHLPAKSHHPTIQAPYQHLNLKEQRFQVHVYIINSARKGQKNACIALKCGNTKTDGCVAITFHPLDGRSSPKYHL